MISLVGSILMIVIARESFKIEQQQTLGNTQTDQLFCYYLKLTKRFTDSAAWDAPAKKMLAKHANWLDSLGKAGIIICVGKAQVPFNDPLLFGMAVLKATNIQEAKKIMLQDPALSYGTHTGEVIPFSINIWYPQNHPLSKGS